LPEAVSTSATRNFKLFAYRRTVSITVSIPPLPVLFAFLIPSAAKTVPSSPDMVLLTAGWTDASMLLAALVVIGAIWHGFSLRKRLATVNRDGRAQARLWEDERDKLIRTLHEFGSIPGRGNWIVDLTAGTIRLSPTFLELLGRPPEGDRFQPIAPTWTKIVFPEDVDAAHEAIARIQRERTAFRFEIRLLHAEGYPVPVEVWGEVVEGADGNIERCFGTIEDATTGRQLSDRMKLFETLISNMSDAMIVTDSEINPPGPRVVFVNRAFVEMTGYSAKEVIGKSPRSLQGPETSRGQLDRLRTALERQEQIRVELVNRRKDGKQYTVELEVVPILAEDGSVRNFLAVQRDITQRRQAEQQLHDLTERYRLAIEAGKIGVWDCDVRANSLVLDDVMLRLYGRSAWEFDGTIDRWSEWVHMDDRARLISEIVSHSGGSDFQTDFRIVLPDGSLRYLRALAHVTQDGTGNLHRIVGVNIDVTASREAEEKLIEARHIAEEASRAKGDFLAVMSHEIRTPMNSVLGFADLLLESKLEEEQRQQVELIRSSGVSLLGLLNDILDYSKIESRQVRLEPARIKIRDAVGEACATLRPLARRKQLELRETLDPALPAELVTDPARLRQVLLNLLANAVKFTSQGSVLLAVRRTGNGVRFEVTDTGIGIPKARIAELFQPFAQIRSARSRTAVGTGLGLLISQNLVQLMGGQIEVESEEGKGSTFGFTLPLEREASPADIPVAGLSLTPATVSVAAPLHVLIAEDNAVNQRLMRLMLEKVGCTSEIASDGREALSKLQETHRFDVVLMDLQMPHMDGLTATKVWREKEQTEELGHLPIIAVTANAMEDDRARCEEAGMDGYLAKPISLPAIREALAPFVRKETGQNGV